MSSDDAVAIRKVNNFWYVVYYFADNVENTDNFFQQKGLKFNDLESAMRYGSNIHAEYGVVLFN